MLTPVKSKNRKVRNSNFNFPVDKFEKLIKNIGWENLEDWITFWMKKEDILSINKFWNASVSNDWIWGLALPLLSQSLNFTKNYLFFSFHFRQF